MTWFVPLDPADRAWCGIDFTRVVTGLDLPSAEDVVAAVAALPDEAPHLARWIDVGTARHRRVARDERGDWAAAAVADPRQIDGPAAAVEYNGHDLGDLPFRLLVGPDWLSLRFRHSVGDGWSSNQLLAHLLRRAAAGGPVPLPWTELRGVRRDLWTTRQLVERRSQLVDAVRTRSDLAGGTYVPVDPGAAAVAAFPVLPGALASLRRLRERSYPGISLAALAVTAIRAVLVDVLPAVRPGFECVFDTRAAGTVSEHAFGNFSAGVFLTPSDDRDPVAVAQALAAARRRGLPELSSASLRVKSWRRAAPELRAAAPEGAARLTLSWAGPHAVPELVGARPDTTVHTMTAPNGRETITFELIARGQDVHASICLHDDVWDLAAVTEAVTAVLTDPAAALDSPREAVRS